MQLRIFEPPRFFEAFLRGRGFTEVPDITARICGICPVAYQTSAVQAMEDACGVAIDDGPIRALRRLLYCGEWIESHALHVYMLHAPDFLGYESAIAMAADHREIVERGLLMKKAGNALMAAVGGREIHPINVRVGGFYRAPSRAELQPAAELFERRARRRSRPCAGRATLPFPEFEHDHELVALSDAGEYPIDRGRIVSSHGLDIAPGEWDEVFAEEPVAHSNALHARIRGRGAYLAGPLARFNLNFDALSPVAREAALAAGVGPTCRNPFQSIVVRSVEMLYACDEALRIIAEYEPPDPPAVEVVPRPGVGFGVSEAPRGLFWHRYEIDGDGHDPRRADRAADLPEPARDRARPARLRAAPRRPSRRRAARPLRAGDPQPRPVHLLRHPLPDARCRAHLTRAWWWSGSATTRAVTTRRA